MCDLPNGQRAAILRGIQRARIGAGVVSERAGLFVQAEPITEGMASVRVDGMARELRVVLQELASLRNSRRLPEILRTVTVPGGLARAVTFCSSRCRHQKASPG